MCGAGDGGYELWKAAVVNRCSALCCITCPQQLWEGFSLHPRPSARSCAACLCVTKDSIHTSQRNIHLRESEACLSAWADPESASLPWITKGRLKRVAGASLLCFREGRMGIHHSACSATSQGFPPSVNLGMMPSRSVGYCGSSGWIETQSCSSALF